MPSQIQTCLIAKGNAEELANFYTSIFPDGKIISTSYGPKSKDDSGLVKPGSVLMVIININGTTFQVLNQGPDVEFTPAISFSIICDTQEEIDHFYEKLGEGGKEERKICGWLEDKFGVSWQIVPRNMGKWIGGKGDGAGRAFAAMLKMKKLEISKLEAAFNGEDI